MSGQALISPSELSGFMRRSPVVLIDTRDPAQFDEGHIAGAVNLREVFTFLSTASSGGLPGLRSQIARRPMAAAIARMRGMEVGESLPLAARIDFQQIFSGFQTFPSGQLPLGGLCVTERALAAADQRDKIDAIARAYGEAVTLFMRDPATVAGAMSGLFRHYYEPLGAVRFNRALVRLVHCSILLGSFNALTRAI